MERRNLLKIFGLSSAAIVNTDAAEVSFEKVTDFTAKPLKNELSPFAMDVVKGQLYSAFVVDDSFVEYRRTDGIETFDDRKFDCRLKERHQFFNYELGQANPYNTPWVKPGDTITYAETNMFQAGRLDPPRAFASQRLGVVFSPKCDAASRSELINNYSVSMWIGQKQFFRAPMSEMFSVGEPTNKQFPELPVQGMVDVRPLPLIMQYGYNFHAEIVGKPFKSGYIKMWVVYDGLDARVVQ